VSDAVPGIRRQRAGTGFVYVAPDGTRIRDRDELRRIRALVLPPAWRDVWICPSARGHMQATARDAKGRKQYRYHPRWRAVRDETKFGRMIAFAQALPRIRAQTESDLALPGLPRDKVLAAVVQLLGATLIRVGNEEYARQNGSFGLTTMRDRHVDVSGSRLRFRFRGKSGREHTIDIQDRRLARVVKRCQDVPGQTLFQYREDDGTQQTIGSEDVNEYLRRVTGEDFTAKDFRTWAGTVLAACALQELEWSDSETQAKKNIVRAIESVAERLGNTRAVCRTCYVHPAVFDAYLDGTLLETLQQRAADERAQPDALSGEEAGVMALLQRRLAREGTRADDAA
jgi:DNA topoisomerase-1